VKINQKAFSAIEILILIAVIGVLVGVGWLLYQRNYKKTAPITSTNTRQNQDIKYLAFSELGVRIRLTGPIQDAYYKVLADDLSDDEMDQIDLSLNSLANTQCKAGGWPPAAYLRYNSSSIDFVSGKPYTEIYGTNHKIGNYYYVYVDGHGINANGGCQSTVANQNKANEAAKAFKAALDTIQATN